MKNFRYYIIIGLLSFIPLSLFAHVTHLLDVSFSPSEHSISVKDEITVNNLSQTVTFSLNRALTITAIVGATIETVIPQGEVTLFTINPAGNKFFIEYSGIIFDPIDDNQSQGLISDSGVALFGSSYWYPVIDNELVSFQMKVHLPEGWSSVSQGVKNELTSMDMWQENLPQKTIYLMANRFKQTHLEENGIQASTYFLKDEPELAQKFIASTHQFIALYSDMLGGYPYKKFALVENFWETGFGMPSFTLLGTTVAHLPFIFYSSYPHEILHNWWGNSVYVDYDNGNWCEGLTTYLADHFLQIHRQTDAAYRQSALKKFADFISSDNDYPLRQFVTKADNRAEAIGYSKGMMFFHMLQIRVGEEQFLKSLQHFYQNYKFKTAGFDDIKTSFETITGQNLNQFFHQWIDLPGVPQLTLENVQYEDDLLSFSLTQKEQHLYELIIPIELISHDKVVKTTITLNQSTKSYTFYSKNLTSLKVDPNIDVFRSISNNESAPGLSQIFGSQELVTIITPEDENRYEALAQELSKNFSKVKIVSDKNYINSGTIIILGKSNKLRSTISDHPDYSISTELEIANNSYIDKSAAMITTSKSGQQVMYIQAQSGMEIRVAQKIIHYGKYSAVAFDGESNILKMAWGIYDSPLNYNFK